MDGGAVGEYVSELEAKRGGSKTGVILVGSGRRRGLARFDSTPDAIYHFCSDRVENRRLEWLWAGGLGIRD